jgi:signal transduction histidine kinase
MARVRLRTKFFLSFLLTSLGLTFASLLVVRHSVEKQVREEISGDLRNSVDTFQNVQRQRESALSRSAELLASLPTLKALMTTSDAATIQDASGDIWNLSASSLLVLTDRSGRVVALHTDRPGFTAQLAQKALRESLGTPETTHWWFGAGHLYEVFLQPIYFGPSGQSTLLGLVAVGYEIDQRVTDDVARVARSQVAFQYGDAVAVSTLSREQESELVQQTVSPKAGSQHGDIKLGGERFLSSSVELSRSSTQTPVRLIVLKSYDQGTLFLRRLNHMLIVLGAVTTLIGGVMVLGISHTFTRPLKNLVAGVRSLESGDYSYPLPSRGKDEVAEVTSAFLRMRQTLRTTQERLLEAERLATIGTMASSISHDLRHALTAVLANAEFLCDSGLDEDDREDLYQEIGVAVNHMTELMESLVEFSRTRESLHLQPSSIETIIQRAAGAVHAHPEFHQVPIVVSSDGPATCLVDRKKMERVFYNLLLNACDAVPPGTGLVQVKVTADDVNRQLLIRVADNGHGIATHIQDKVFQAFTSFGKENGTGLGLAVVQKIVHDHGGEISVEPTSSAGTVFRLVLPTGSLVCVSSDNAGHEVSAPPPSA